MVSARKLTAILMADVVGFSRLMREDEANTYAELKALREDILPRTIAPFGGRLIKDMGDGFLLTFESAVQAVECGIALQETMERQNRLQLRAGVNVGDVIVEDNDVFGDGVNVTARLEAICVPGGICMSDNVYEQVRDKLKITVESLKPQQLKNIDRPVCAHQWHGAAKKLTDTSHNIDLSERPSIAVLAFDNMSSDPEQEFFAEGIAEDIITALSRIERFFVVSRTSSFSFKGQSVGVKEIGEALGVRYVLEGSVRAAGNRLRVTAQLIEASTGQHVWAEKYDRMSEDVFDIQDEITRNITSTVWWELIDTEEFAIPNSERTSLPVWRLVSISWSHVYKMTQASLQEAIKYANKAIELAPENGRAHQALAMAVFHRAAMFGKADDVSAAMKEALRHAESAVRYAYGDEWSYLVRGMIHSRTGQIQKAMSDLNRALDINPNCSLAHGVIGGILSRTGKPAEAIEAEMLAIATSPRSGDIFFRYTDLALCNLLLGDDDKAIDWSRRALSHRPELVGANVFLIAALQASGREAERKIALEEFETAFGSVDDKALAHFLPSEPEHNARVRGLLVQSGLLS